MAVTMLKACYRQGDKCSRNEVDVFSPNYILEGTQAEYDNSMFSLASAWKRVNTSGHGVTAAKNLYCQQTERSTPEGENVSHFFKLSGIDYIIMEYIAARVSNKICSMDIALRDGKNIAVGSRSATQTVILRGREGIFYALCLNSLMTQAAEYAAVAEYEYNPQWTSVAVWDFLMLSSTASGAVINGAANLRKAQQAIVDLVAQHTAQGGDISTITWYQMLYYCINTTSKTNRVTEYVDAATAKTWCEENAPAAVAKYF